MRFMQTESVLQTKNRSGPAKDQFSVALAQTILLVLSWGGSFMFIQIVLTRILILDIFTKYCNIEYADLILRSEEIWTAETHWKQS